MLNALSLYLPVPSFLRPANSATDGIQNVMGAFGKYHYWICFLIFVNKFPIGWHQLSIVFLIPKAKYTCEGSTDPEPCPCANPVYDTSVLTSTMVTEFNLICERAWMASMTSTLFQTGTLIGSIIFGMASDRFGRRKPLILAVILQLGAAVSTTYMQSYALYNFCRFLVGLSVGGTMVVGFVIVMEFVGAQYREVVSALYQLPYNVAYMSLPVFAYYTRDHRWFNFYISLPGAALLSYIFLLPETPRWLLAMKRNDEAEMILKQVAICNNRPTGHIRAEINIFQYAASKNALKRGNIIDLFRTPNIRKNILAMAYNWLTCSYCFYGVSQYVGHLTGNIFLNVSLGAISATLGTIFSIPLMKYLGRKTILIMMNGICASVLLLLIFARGSQLAVFCASMGQASAFISFVVVYLYASELFPTVVRNAAMGFASMSARVGAMIAPFVVQLNFMAHWMPPLGFAVVPLCATFVSLLLPETKGCKLMTTIEEGENFGKVVKK